MRGRNRANENEIAIFVFGVTTKHFSHVDTPFLYGTDITPLRYRIPRCCLSEANLHGIESGSYPRSRLSIFNPIHSLLRNQMQILYRS